MKQIIIIILLVQSFYLYPQERKINKCGSMDLLNSKLNSDSDFLNNRQLIMLENLRFIEHNKKESNTINIPIVIHIVHRQTHSNIGQGTNISDEQIMDGIRILNEDYSKTNPEFPNPPRDLFTTIAGNPNLKFCLATSDPNGNPTTGITRTASSVNNFDYYSSTGNYAMKRDNLGGKNSWDTEKYLNIWVCDIANGGPVGFATFPGWTPANRDGIVVDYQFFGSIQVANFSDGRTLTHEVGHYLGLFHTFCDNGQGSPPYCCDNDGGWFGGVYDTPGAQGDANDTYYGGVNNSIPSPSDPEYNSCNDLSWGFSSDLPDMHENYMSYAANTWMFTQDQASVMQATLNSSRISLKNSPVSINCSGSTTGINNIQNNIKISPNPSQGIININTKNDIEILEIYNLVSQKILFQNKPGNTIDLSFLKNGNYYLKIKTSSEILISKIVILK